MSTHTILALAALGILALFMAFALANTGRRRHDATRLHDGDSGYIPGVWDGTAGHSSCDSGSSGGDSGGGDCGGH